VLLARRDPDCPLHVRVGEVVKLNLGSRATVGELDSALGPDREPLSWVPFRCAVECPACSFSEPRSDIPRDEPCPKCGVVLRSQNSIELSQAPKDVALSALGVAPREIIPARSPQATEWFELNN